MSRHSDHHVYAQKAAFTLIEVLIATGLALFLVSVAISLYVGSKKLIERAQTRLELHQRARTLYDTLADTGAAVVPTCACAVITLRSDQSSPAALLAMPGQVTLVFMRSTLPDADFQMGSGYSGLVKDTADQRWECWTWDRASRVLRIARGRTKSVFTNDDTSWKKNGLSWTHPEQFGIWAQPRRTFATVVESAAVADRIAHLWSELDDNRWGGMADPENIGDGTDLTTHLASAMEDVEDLAFEIGCVDPAKTTRADDADNRCVVYDGVYVDGTASAAEVAARPRVLRLRFTLTDHRGALRQVFSYSFPLSSFTP